MPPSVGADLGAWLRRWLQGHITMRLSWRWLAKVRASYGVCCDRSGDMNQRSLREATTRWPDSRSAFSNPMAQHGTRCRPPYEDRHARVFILANSKQPKGRIRFCRLIKPSSNCHLQPGRAMFFAPPALRWALCSCCRSGRSQRSSLTRSAPAGYESRCPGGSTCSSGWRPW